MISKRMRHKVPGKRLENQNRGANFAVSLQNVQIARRKNLSRSNG